MAPGKFVPIQGAVRIIDVAPKDDTVLAGQSESFSVEVESPSNRPLITHLDVAYASGKTARYEMTASGAGNSKYTYTLASVAEDLNYTIMAGDSQSERYHITVRPDIHLISYKMLVNPPAYTGKPEETVVVGGKGFALVSQGVAGSSAGQHGGVDRGGWIWMGCAMWYWMWPITRRR